jgi:hemoglobin/transferrin/lactoferrin receptor protein
MRHGSRRRRLSPARPFVAAAACIAMSTSRTEAQEVELSGGVLQLDAITVTAAAPVGEPAVEPTYGALSPTSVWTRGKLQPLEPSGVAEVLDLVPSVTTQTTPNDPGAAVSVRGLQDFGRVNVTIDGARQNFQKSGHGANGTFYFDTEMLRAVKVTRGPSVGVNGGGAIGGTVSFTTLDADDVLDPDETVALRLKSTLETNAPSFMGHGEAAARLSDSVDVVAAATWRDAGDYKAGGGETINSAQDLASGLAKARIRPTDAHDISVSALHYDSSFDSALLDTASSNAIADTYTLNYHWTPESDWADLTAKTYYTTTQVTNRNKGDPDERYAIGTAGLDLDNTSRFETGSVFHSVTYGIDGFHDRVETRDPAGTSDDLTPSGERIVYGAFVEDKAEITHWLEVVGGLRFDGYELDGNGMDNGGSHVSPKLTVGLKPFDPVTIYATYAEGYRPPAITETLIDGFHPPPVSTGRFLPNPDLKAEVAHNLEGGVGIDKDGVLLPDDQLHARLGVFQNRVDNYIEQVFEMFPLPGGYQYQNVAKARIEGVELELAYDAGFAFTTLSGQLMRGVDEATDDELTSVPPNRIVAIVGFRAFDRALEAGTKITAAAAKDGAEALGLVGDAYQIVDLFAGWRFNEDASANLVLSNIFDRRYTEYPNGSPSPGFNAKFSFVTRIGG